MATRCRVLLTDLGQLLRRKPVGKANQRRPQPAMNQSHLAIDQATDKDQLGSSNGSQNCVDVMTLRVRPPTTLDCSTHDGLGQARSSSLGRNEDDTMFAHEGQCLFSGRTPAHNAQFTTADSLFETQKTTALTTE